MLLCEYRDLFALTCLTDLRFSDFSTLKPEDLRRDMLYKKQEKYDHWVIIPLREEAKHIFIRQFKEKMPAFTNRSVTAISKPLANWLDETALFNSLAKSETKVSRALNRNTTGSLRILPADPFAPMNFWQVRRSS